MIEQISANTISKLKRENQELREQITASKRKRRAGRKFTKHARRFIVGEIVTVYDSTTDRTTEMEVAIHPDTGALKLVGFGNQSAAYIEIKPIE